jgi:L,D-transpeptidase-like protein
MRGQTSHPDIDFFLPPHFSICNFLTFVDDSSLLHRLLCRARIIMASWVSRSAVLVGLLLSAGLMLGPILEASPAFAQGGYMSRAVYGTSIIIRTQQRRLQLMNGGQTVRTYTIAVGRAGMKWYGQSQIASKMIRPAWMPTAAIKAENPRLPDYIEGGAHNNPMGAAALVLAGGKYAIHGTNRPSSIGTFASHGCFRMHNRDVLDLFGRVSVGTPVTVIP